MKDNRSEFEESCADALETAGNLRAGGDPLAADHLEGVVRYWQGVIADRDQSLVDA